MKKIPLFILLLLSITGLSLRSQSTAKGTLSIKLTGIRDGKGYMLAGMNPSASGWPREAVKELKWSKQGLRNGELVVEVPDLPFGTWAVSILDDENKNFEMDMRFGIPQEGYGFSNDAPVGLGPPKFEKAAFEFSSSGQQITIQIKYMGKGN
jgi:uncharacterized protein (DUF2141 family)